MFLSLEEHLTSGKPGLSEFSFIIEQQDMICEQHIFLSIKRAQMEVFTSSWWVSISHLKNTPWIYVPSVISLRHQVKNYNRSNLISVQWWPIWNNSLLETSSYKRLHYNMWLQLRVKDLFPHQHFISQHYFTLHFYSICGFIFHPSAGQQSPFFAQPVSVSFYNLPKLITKLNEGKACSETSFVPIHKDLARKGSLPIEAS